MSDIDILLNEISADMQQMMDDMNVSDIERAGEMPGIEGMVERGYGSVLTFTLKGGFDSAVLWHMINKLYEGTGASVTPYTVPKVDGSENADNANSGGGTQASGSGDSISIKTNLGDIPGIGEFLSGATLTTGYETDEISTVANTSDIHDITAALTYNIGNLALGVQRKYHNEGETSIATDEVFYKDLAIGVSYAVNDQLSVSYNRYDSDRHNNTTGVNPTQSTQAFNIGYTMGGMTIGFQEASTDDAGWVKDAEDDSRTLGVSVAF